MLNYSLTLFKCQQLMNHERETARECDSVEPARE